MKAPALYILAISTLTEAGSPWNHDARGQDLVKRHEGSNGPNALNIAPGVARGFKTLVGGYGAVKPGVQVHANSTPFRPKSNANSGSNGRKQHNGQQPPSGQQPPNSEKPPIGREPTGPGFEGLRISTVTVTAQGLGAPTAPATVTVTQLASQENGGGNVTVTITEMASTVTQTVTASCAANNSQQQQPPAPPARPAKGDQREGDSTSPGQVIVIIDGGQGNGHHPKASKSRVAVERCSMVEPGSPEVVCGRTTRSSLNVVSSTTKQASQAQPEVLPTTNANGNGVGVSTVPIAHSALPKTTHSVNTPASPSEEVPPKAQPASSPSSSSSLTQAPPLATAQPTSKDAPSSTSVASPSRLAESLALGGLGPSPTATKDSAVAPGATPGSGVVGPAQPVVNLSGHSLKSFLDLGNLLQQNIEPRSTTRDL